jgi:hypothetical protein
MDVDVLRFDHGSFMTRERIQHAFMRGIFAMLVSADDYQNLARMLASNFRKNASCSEAER